MILINGKEIIDDVIINEDGTFETTDVPGRFWVSDETEVIEKERFVDNRLPYIEYPSSVYVKNEKYESFLYYHEEIGHVDDVICETGYINIDSGQKIISPIQIGNIGIKKLLIQTKAYKGYHSYGLSRSEYEELIFHYEFTIKITVGEYSFEHTFYADITQPTEHHYFQKKRKYNSSPIKTLLGGIVPLLNGYINSGFSIKQINLNYLNQLLPQKEEDNYNVHPFMFSDALDIVYGLQVIKGKDSILIEVGKDLKPYMNLYIVSLINSILGVNLQQNKETGTYIATIDGINFPSEIISLQNYLQCLLYYGIYENFDAEKAKEQYLILPSSQDNNKIELIKDYLNVHVDIDFLRLYDFISDMGTTHIEDGMYRAGRDDYEWKVKTFIIPCKKTFWASDIFIEKINEILGIKLEFQEEFKSENYWDENKNHPARYYYSERYDDGYIGGLACSRHDIGSAKLKQESFYNLLDYFMKKYISGK